MAEVLADLWAAGYQAMPEGSGIKVQGVGRMTITEAEALLERVRAG